MPAKAMPTVPTVPTVPLPDSALADLARFCGSALEAAYHHGDRQAALVMQRAMMDLTLLRDARTPHAARPDTCTAEGCHHGR